MENTQGSFHYTNLVKWFVRDSRSSPYVRVIGKKEFRFNPSPELDKFEAIKGRQDTQHTEQG